MKRLSGFIGLLLIILGVPGMICGISIIGYVAFVKVQSTLSINEILGRIDPHFNMPLASTGSIDDLMPAQVGSFARVSTVPPTIDICSDGEIFHPHMGRQTEYSAGGQNTIDMYAFRCPGEALDQIIGPASCAPDLGGAFDLRSDVKTTYVYWLCEGALIGIGKDFGNRIIWSNGDWLISLSGNIDNLVQFLHHYKY